MPFLPFGISPMQALACFMKLSLESGVEMVLPTTSYLHMGT